MRSGLLFFLFNNINYAKMNKLYTLLLTMLLALAGTVHTWAETEDFSGKVLSMGNTVTSLETGKWYFISCTGTGRFIREGNNNTLGLTTTSPHGLEADSNLGYLVQLESTDTEDKYYLKTARGRYFGLIKPTSDKSTLQTPVSTSGYTIKPFNDNAGHWILRSNGRYILQDNNGALNGSTSTGSLNGDRDWTIREAILKSTGELTGNAYIKYVLGKGGLVRLTSRRTPTANLAQIGDKVQGTQALETDLAQVWILNKSGDGYTLRNASTGAFLTPGNDFRTPGTNAARLYIEGSVNNANNSSYINIASNADFSGKECLNLGNDGTSLYKWTREGDDGCDWTITLVENFDLDKVKEDLMANSKYKIPQAGKYYRIHNINYKTYMNEGTNSHNLNCEALKEDKLSQYWTLVKVGNDFAIQNMCTQRYISRQGGNVSVIYSTQEAKPTQGFIMRNNGDESTYNYYIVDEGSRGLHCDQASNVVGWNTNGLVTSTWGFEEVQLTDEFIQQGRDELNAFNNLKANIGTYNKALANLFKDKACTILKDNIQALTDEQLEANADYHILPDAIKAMVKKVKNNTWQVYTRDNGYSRDFEKFFRVRDDYKVYSNHSRMNQTAYAGMRYAFGKLSGPTGIVGKTGDIIYIYVDQQPSSDCTLQLEVVKDSNAPGAHQTGSTYRLNAGLNMVVMNEPSTLYVFYQLNDPEKYLANYPDMKIHIEGGELQGYFDLTRGMTNEDWMLLREKLLDKSNIINMKGDRVVHVMLCDLVKKALANSNNEMEGIVRVWNKICQSEDELMGFEEHLKGRFRNIWNAFSADHGYMYATNYGTYYSDGTLNSILNYKNLTTNSGTMWGPSHEMGHNHQDLINVVGATEVSNNLFANVNVFLQGVSTTRGNAVHDALNYFADGKSWFDMSIWTQTRMYFQLYLYYHAQGHNPRFYQTLFKLLREDPMSKRSGDYDSSLKNGSGKAVGGYITYGRQNYLHLAKKICDAAQADLSEFFEVYGFFHPQEKRYIGDYSDYWVTTTQKDIDEAKAYMHRYPKGPNIIFIDDRVKESPTIKNGPLEGKPSRDVRVDYESTETRRIGYSDVGQWGDFVDDYTTNGYYYLTSYSQGKTTYRMFGSGAIGYKIYNSEGKLVFLSNKNTFTLPNNVVNKLGDNFTIMAAEGNGYDVIVPYAPKAYRGEITAYYAGNPTPHKVYYYGTGEKGESRISELPANSVAYIVEPDDEKKAPTAGLLAQTNVVNSDMKAQSLVVDGEKPFFIPTAFTAEKATFTKGGTLHQALSLPFDVKEGYVGVLEGVHLKKDRQTAPAGKPVIFKGKVNLTATDTQVIPGTWGSSTGGCVLNASGTEVVASTGNNSPFTYVWEDAFVIDATSINSVLEEDAEGQNKVFDLQGRRVTRINQPGIYIINGKKTLVK